MSLEYFSESPFGLLLLVKIPGILEKLSTKERISMVY